MPLQNYIRNHYQEACGNLRGINRDPPIINMLARNNNHNQELVIDWMTHYRLFQGIRNEIRNQIAARFLQFATGHQRYRNGPSIEQITGLFTHLYTLLFQVQNRGWMSATSKLLWCLYPQRVAIYDSFVHRTLTVLQCLNDNLQGFERIGVAPTPNNEGDIALATEHYMNYFGMVQTIKADNQNLLNELRQQHNEIYPYDVRIVDKLLWMMGNPNHPIQQL